MKNSNKWISWGLLVIGFIVVFFHRLSIGTVADQLTNDLNLDSIQIANLASMTFYGYALMQLPVGIMVDTIGVRKICTLGMGITAIGSVLFGMAGHIYLAYFARFLVGIGTSVIIVSIMKIQTKLFPVNMYSTLSGLTSFFGNFGAFFATLPLSFIALNIGWRATFLVLGIITVILALGIHFFVNERANETIPETINVREGVAYVIANKKIYPDFFVMIFFVGSLTAVLGLWGSGYMKTVYQISNEQAAFYLSFITYGFIIGAPIVGKLSDILGGAIKKILIFSSCVYALLWAYVLVVQKGKPPLDQWTVLYFLMGIMIISHILVFSNVKEINPLKYTGIAISLVNIGEFVGSGLISLAMGFTIKRLTLTGMPLEAVYRSAMILILVSAILSFMSVLLMHHDKKM